MQRDIEMMSNPVSTSRKKIINFDHHEELLHVSKICVHVELVLVFMIVLKRERLQFHVRV